LKGFAERSESNEIPLDSSAFIEATPTAAGSIVQHEQALKAATLANQNAALVLQNANLETENMLMRMRAQQGAMPYAMQDPYGYMCNPWGMPPAACPPVYQDPVTMRGWFASKFAPKAGRKKNKSDNGSWGSSTASGGSDSWGTGSLQSSVGSDAQTGVPHNALEDTLPHERTTVMVRNIPNNCSREQLITFMNDEGFEGFYTLVYLPIDLKNRVGLGYAFIDFISNAEAVKFMNYFQGFDKWNMKSEKVCDVAWSDALQGLDEHVERYRDSPVMHDSVPEEFKPVLFKNGERVPFPEPTKRIRAPRPWT